MNQEKIMYKNCNACYVLSNLYVNIFYAKSTFPHIMSINNLSIHQLHIELIMLNKIYANNFF